MPKKTNTVEFLFMPGDFVIIDGCKHTKAVVVCCKYRGSGHTLFDVEWMSGSMQAATVEEWRLETWEE